MLFNGGPRPSNRTTAGVMVFHESFIPLFRERGILILSVKHMPRYRGKKCWHGRLPNHPPAPKKLRARA